MLQKIRKPIVISTAVLFHLLLIFHLLFSPVIIVFASWKGIINASFVVFVLMAVLSLFFGRAYCSWFCPGCGVQQVISLIIKKKSENSKAILIKYVIFALWAGAIVAGYIVNGFRSVDFGYGMSDITIQRKIILTIGAILIIVPLTAIFGQFASCKYVCWAAPLMIFGTKIRNFFHFPGLRLKADKDKCSGCLLCNKNCPMNLPVSDHVKIGLMDHDECILCGNCVDHCKINVIKFTVSK